MKNISKTELQKLVNLHYDLIIPLNICDMELWCNYEGAFKEKYGREMTEEDLEREVKKDILYNYVFNFLNVEKAIDNALETYITDTAEYQAIKTMVKELCKTLDLDSKVIFGIEI